MVQLFYKILLFIYIGDVSTYGQDIQLRAIQEIGILCPTLCVTSMAVSITLPGHKEKSWQNSNQPTYQDSTPKCAIHFQDWMWGQTHSTRHSSSCTGNQRNIGVANICWVDHFALVIKIKNIQEGK